LSRENYKKAQNMSETVAQLFEQGYSARQVTIAINKIGEDNDLEDYKQAMRRNYAGYVEGGKVSRPIFSKSNSPYIGD
jgi:hypothetical protein